MGDFKARCCHTEYRYAQIPVHTVKVKPGVQQPAATLNCITSLQVPVTALSALILCDPEPVAFAVLHHTQYCTRYAVQYRYYGTGIGTASTAIVALEATHRLPTGPLYAASRARCGALVYLATGTCSPLPLSVFEASHRVGRGKNVIEVFSLRLGSLPATGNQPRVGQGSRSRGRTGRKEGKDG